LASVFSRPQKLIKAPGYSIVHGWILDRLDRRSLDLHDSRKRIDEVLISVYRAPKSYTGEDGADISCHGGIAVVKAVMGVLKAQGFRDALPGEFTFRAFMNGKLDLTRCESVMELVGAKTDRCREHAVRRLSGILAQEITDVKNLLVQVLAGTEIYLDYSEDEFVTDDEAAGTLPDRGLAEDAVRRLKALADLWRQERIYAEGALVVLAGRPTAGKSSLFNYLLREDRSIVTDIPGTTRDWIEALMSVEGIPVHLADTAGLRNSAQSDEAERIGIQRSLELLESADLVLYVIDGTQGITKEDREFFQRNNAASSEKLFILLWNKADLAPAPVNLGQELPGPV
jgi:tRNA modification GTPase